MIEVRYRQLCLLANLSIDCIYMNFKTLYLHVYKSIRSETNWPGNTTINKPRWLQVSAINLIALQSFYYSSTHNIALIGQPLPSVAATGGRQPQYSACVLSLAPCPVSPLAYLTRACSAGAEVPRSPCGRRGCCAGSWARARRAPARARPGSAAPAARRTRPPRTRPTPTAPTPTSRDACTQLNTISTIKIRKKSKFHP